MEEFDDDLEDRFEHKETLMSNDILEKNLGGK